MKRILLSILVAAAFCPPCAHAQMSAGDEVIVTASRRDTDDYSAERPAVGLRRTADFAVQKVTITGDSRDPDLRAQEIYAMLANAIAAAPKAGIALAFGQQRVQALSLQNYRALTLTSDRRPDSQKLLFLAKAPLASGGSAEAAQARITAFIKAVKPVGRALMETTDDLTLSVVDPDQYRPAIADAIAADAKAMAAKLGPDYGVSIEGLNRPVEWARAGLGEVQLYIPYKLVVEPKR